jgi:GH25 family lysozyme M1 (1,4-beta-N-acetylmuramidase)
MHLPRRRAFDIAATVALTTVYAAASPSLAQRAVGVDVSAWQGTVDWQTVARPVAQGGGGKQFAFIRSTRGGTTGFYNQSDPNNNNGLNTLSQRYDDPFFVSNMNGATAAGMFAGPYHFARPDIIETTLNANGIANTGLDEANHMLEIAGPYMKPGYLLPVFDLEAGQNERTSSQLSAFAVEFSNRIFEVKGVRPIIYINQNYANYVNSTVPTAFPNLWLARWPNQSNPGAIDIQNGNPPPSPAGSNVYGRWNPTFPTIPTPEPWEFWQYASTTRVPGIGGGNVNVDGNVANGGIEFVKDFLVPALWFVNASGSWTDPTRWNSNPGLPGPNDRVILDRTAGNYTITLPSGTQNVRSLAAAEQFVQTGGTLNVQQFVTLTNSATLSGGAMSAGSITNTSTLHITGGVVNTGSFLGSGTTSVAGGTLNAASVRQTTLNVSSGMVRLAASGTTSVSIVNNLNATGGQLDLGNEGVIVNYSAASPATAIRNALASAYANGAWTGAGITSSNAIADPTDRTAVGFADAFEIGNPATFLGQPIDTTSVLIRYTLYGDTNLSGVVDIADFSNLAANFNVFVPRWSRGDFNFDGVVSVADFALLAANFNQSIAAEIARPAAVPEPATVAVLSAAASILLTRRRDRVG